MRSTKFIMCCIEIKYSLRGNGSCRTVAMFFHRFHHSLIIKQSQLPLSILFLLIVSICIALRQVKEV